MEKELSHKSELGLDLITFYQALSSQCSLICLPSSKKNQERLFITELQKYKRK